MFVMARGWESKSVEEQQSQAAETPLTNEDKERIQQLQNAERMRRVQALNLTRARVMEQLQRSQSDRYNELLKRELSQIEEDLRNLQ